jgi:hypothetical protein
MTMVVVLIGAGAIAFMLMFFVVLCKERRNESLIHPPR